MFSVTRSRLFAAAILFMSVFIFLTLNVAPAAASPAIEIEKHTNGEDADFPIGPEILVGDPVLWEYIVTNVGNLNLKDVVVTDDQGVVVSCPQAGLDQGESMICTGTGIAQAGQYANIGCADVMRNGRVVTSDCDPSHYYGTETTPTPTATTPPPTATTPPPTATTPPPTATMPPPTATMPPPTATTPPPTATTPPTDGGCTYTQGYWKSHGPDAKGNNSNEWPVTSLTIGGISYTDDQLQEILDEPVRGNGLVSLSHQLIAAKLNVANGADDAAIAGAIADADALITGLIVPPIGNDSLNTAVTSSLNDALTDFNEGTSGPGHCD